jgi:hypothetical protein
VLIEDEPVDGASVEGWPVEGAPVESAASETRHTLKSTDEGREEKPLIY